MHEMRRTFGDDTLFLIGGGLLERGSDLEDDAREFAHCAGRDRPYHRAATGDLHVNDAISSYETLKITSAKSTMTNGTSTIAGKESTSASVAEVERVANAVRRRVLEYTLKNNGGYLSQACSSAETLATLYLKSLRLGPSVAPSIPGPFRGSPGPGIETITVRLSRYLVNHQFVNITLILRRNVWQGEGHNGDPTSPTLDRLIFSPVHYALPLYSVLVEVGRLDAQAFETYNKDGSTVELIGAEHSPGHAVTAGSLGQALSQAGGIAHARRLKGHTGRVVVYMSDGEMQEGQVRNDYLTLYLYLMLPSFLSCPELHGTRHGKLYRPSFFTR